MCVCVGVRRWIASARDMGIRGACARAANGSFLENRGRGGVYGVLVVGIYGARYKGREWSVLENDGGGRWLTR